MIQIGRGAYHPHPEQLQWGSDSPAYDSDTTTRQTRVHPHDGEAGPGSA